MNNVPPILHINFYIPCSVKVRQYVGMCFATFTGNLMIFVSRMEKINCINISHTQPGTTAVIEELRMEKLRDDTDTHEI